jgi:hypothetical protein
MAWDKDIPVPTKAPKWDFEGAELGHSMGFDTKEQALKCAGAFRFWALKNDKPWAPLVDTSFCSGWRMWIVEKRNRVKKSPKHEHIQPVMLKIMPPDPVVHEFPAQQSTDTDDDIMLSTDTRRGGSVVIGKQPEARPIEVVDEVTATGRRRKKRVAAE